MTANKWLAGALLCVIALAFASAFQRPQTHYSDQVAVLMYHHIHDTDMSSSTITTQLFRNQLELLQSRGVRFITLQQFRDYMNGGSVPDNAAMVTFDDGYESFYASALPILEQLHIPAVNFVITGTLDQPLDDIPPKLTREQISQMASDSSLVDFQCHTHAFHGKNDLGAALLLQGKEESDSAYSERVRGDVGKCRGQLQRLRPGEVDTLAYPFGIHTPKSDQYFTEAGIHFAFTISPGMTTRTLNPLDLPRINAGSPYITPEGLFATIQRKVELAGR
jgi:peptidoglycan/xylan/chitin deacetylase (PgdA/CDA1 family)